MKKILFILVFISNFCVAQRTAISLDKMNILYIGVPNPITIVVENYKPSQFKVFINNGTIEKNESELDNQFSVMPKERGKATIYIVVNKKDTISKYEYRVKPIGLPNAHVAHKKSGKISKNELRAQEAIFVRLDGIDFDYKVNISSYQVKIFNKCAISYSSNIEGFYFTPELRTEFDKLEKGDWVIFSDIKIKNVDGKIDSLEKPIFLEIE
jgi:hypothetical protein